MNEVKTKWSKWETCLIGNNDVTTNTFYRTNGKKTQVKSIDGVVGESCCHNEDEFDLHLGIGIAFHRMCIKIIDMNRKTLIERKCEIERDISECGKVRIDILNRLNELYKVANKDDK